MPVQTSWEISWVNPNGSKAGDMVVATIKTDPKRPGSDVYVVPQGKVVVVRELTKKNVSLGGQLEFIVNDSEIIARTADITEYDPANPSRKRITPFALHPGESLKINVYVNANATGADQIESATMEVLVFDEAEFEEFLEELELEEL